MIWRRLKFLTPPEKLQLVEDLWDDLAATPADVPLYEWQREELARRKANLMNNHILIEQEG